MCDIGDPEVSLDNGLSEISGPQCPRVVTFTCNARESSSPRISWYAGETVIATYSYAALDVYPIQVTTATIINATARLSHAYVAYGINYINFTLSMDLTELIPFQGQNITCRTLLRSNLLSIKKFSVRGERFNSIGINHCIR